MSAAEGQRKVVFALLAGTGIRAGDTFGLEIEDLDLDAGLIRIKRSIWNGRAVTVKTKRAKRPINIEPAIAAMLAAHIGDQKSGRVFQTRTGNHLFRVECAAQIESASEIPIAETSWTARIPARLRLDATGE